MPAVTISPNGTLAASSTFVELFRPKPPCTLDYVMEDTKENQWKAQEPTHLSFSSFPSAVKQGVAKHAAGDHVAMSYTNTGNFFSVALVRCDTWSIQWVVSHTDCLFHSQIQQLVVPNADVVCGIYQNEKCHGLFLASRYDIATVSKKENRVDRSYIASPRNLVCTFDTKDIVTVAAGSSDKLLVLLDKGTVFIVDIGADALRSTEAITVGGKILTNKLKNVTRTSKIIVSQVEEFTHVVVFSPDHTGFELITVKTSTLNDDTCAAFYTTVETAKAVATMEMAGPYHAIATYRDPAIQFFTLVPGEAGTDVTPLGVLPLPYTPVATAYSASEQSHRLVCLPPTPSTTVERPGSLVNHLVSAVLPFSEGPYSGEMLKRAQWAPLPNTFKSYSVSDNQQGEEASLSELMRGDLLQLQNAGSNDGTWVPFQMFYVLASTKDAAVNTALFSVKAAPSVHARLAKQWHNATTGLYTLLTCEGGSSRVRLTPWNPRHLRRALRLMSSEQLAHAFHAVAECLRATSLAGETAVYYKDASTAALGIALHIITLSNQIGVAVDPSDVETVAALLRASRAAGHEVTRYTGRMELLLEACLQRRSMQRLLERHMQTGAVADEQLASLQGDFFGIPADLQVERTLLTRFVADSWAQSLDAEAEEHRRTAASAAAYLQQVASLTAAPVLCSWEEKGKRPCADRLLNEFESTLVHLHQ
ncbi:hypothetical protein STCU_01326 [Strigomonas culicis]|uniref:Uncharacterized protein n=1 Tax=Strigomonas culicis TaxID=28005 RepID=S9V179_9TRYP|nr:hypothetical protein STCU_01334 [Strigomonas culicis]EPY34776.1 hypothetical protein STCU_01326 [Strigomonas culicis]|eukprot:EPY34768.1 hypothetical protein STCU_01334 [Strigomonas culicis]